MCVCERVCLCMCMCVWDCVCICVCMCMYVCESVCMCECVCNDKRIDRSGNPNCLNSQLSTLSKKHFYFNNFVPEPQL